MKYLTDYTEEAQTFALKKAGAFFAFTTESFNIQRDKARKYVNLGSGLICPKDTFKQLDADLGVIVEQGIQLDMSENWRNDIIKRELANHECVYTGSPNRAIEALKKYPITEDNILKVFKQEMTKEYA